MNNNNHIIIIENNRFIVNVYFSPNTFRVYKLQYSLYYGTVVVATLACMLKVILWSNFSGTLYQKIKLFKSFFYLKLLLNILLSNDVTIRVGLKNPNTKNPTWLKKPTQTTHLKKQKKNSQKLTIN